MAKTHHQYRFPIIWLSNVKFVNCQRCNQCRICSITSNVKYILANILIQNILNMKCRLWDRPQGKFGEKKKKLRHLYTVRKKEVKRSNRIPLWYWQDDNLAKLNGKRAGRGPERRILSYIDKETRSKKMVQKQNKV